MQRRKGTLCPGRVINAKQMNVEIIVIGDELLIGQVTDTNSGWIARELNHIGWEVTEITTVRDRERSVAPRMCCTPKMFCTTKKNPAPSAPNNCTMNMMEVARFTFFRSPMISFLNITFPQKFLFLILAYFLFTCNVLQKKMKKYTVVLLFFKIFYDRIILV